MEKRYERISKIIEGSMGIDQLEGCCGLIVSFAIRYGMNNKLAEKLAVQYFLKEKKLTSHAGTYNNA